MGDSVRRRDGWLCEIRVEKIHCVGDVQCLRHRINSLLALIMFELLADVLTVAAVLIPKMLCGCGVMDYHFGTQRSQW